MLHSLQNTVLRGGDLLASMLDVLKIITLPVALLCMSWLRYRGLEYVLVNYRWIFVVLFLLPVSLAYDLFFYARNWLIFHMNSAPDMHEEKVQRVQQQVCTVFTATIADTTHTHTRLTTLCPGLPR